MDMYTHAHKYTQRHNLLFTALHPVQALTSTRSPLTTQLNSTEQDGIE